MEPENGMIRPYYPALAVLWRLVDAVIIILAYSAGWLAVGNAWPPDHLIVALPAVVLFSLVGEGAGLYRSWRGAPVKREVARVWLSWILVVPLLLLAGFLTKTSAVYSRAVVTAWFVIAPVFISVWRGLARFGLQELRRRGRNTRSVGIVGATRVGEQVAGEILGSPWLGMHLYGFYDDRDGRRLHKGCADQAPNRGDLEAILRDAKAGKIDLVYIALPLRAEPRIQDIAARLADTTCSVYLVPDLYISSLLKAQWSAVGDMPVVSIFETPFYGVAGWLKRLEDVVLGSLILALVALPMALVALGIKLTSKGPVFFRQRRYGLNGQSIEILKFRTMSVCEDGPVIRQATKDDTRVTPFGAFLRRTSLDELPQFLQVMTGEMSIVGPRPHAVAHNEQYRSLIRGYMLRHKVKPGITGWAQVNGWRGETDTVDKMRKRVEHDLAYIGNWGLSLDLKIILLTAFGRRARENAY